jgi:hyperosmotically inducible protein
MKRIAMLAPAVVVALSMSAPGLRDASAASFENQARDAWLTGKVEMAYTLNAHLNPFDIDTAVEGGVVTLTGMVDSDVDKQLAEQIAAGIEGVADVNNELKVGMSKGEQADTRNDERRDFPSWFDDATTTAAVKSKLIANSSTKGLQIDVDTKEDVVTLSGSVGSDEQKQLAGEIAGNTGDVRDVRNLLVVK